MSGKLFFFPLFLLVGKQLPLGIFDDLNCSSGINMRLQVAANCGHACLTGRARQASVDSYLGNAR